LDLYASSILGRLVIIIEFVLAILLAFPGFGRKALLLSSIYLLLITIASAIGSFSTLNYSFSIFSANSFNIFIGRDLTIYAIFSLFTLYIWKRATQQIHSQHKTGKSLKLVLAALLLTASVAPIVYSAPDFLLFETEQIHEPRSFENDSLYKTLAFSNQDQPQFSDNPYILIAVTPGCPFCQLLTTRVYFLQHHGHIKLPIYFLMLSSDDDDVAAFWKMNYVNPFPYTRLDNMKDLISIAGGRFPALYLMRGNNHYCKMDFRDLKLSRLNHF